MEKRKSEYVAILITYVILISAIGIYLTFGKKYISIPKCQIYKHLGVYCPACGGTRAIISLFHFKLIKSIKYNPVVLYTFIASTIYLIIETINNVFKKNISIKWSIFVKIGLVILIINWIVQNIIILFNNH